jgi:hypothetical protein
MTDDNPLAEGALSRDPDKAHADAYKRRLAQKRAINARYYERKHSKRARRDADEKSMLQSWRDECSQLRETYLSLQPGGVALPVDPVLSKLDASCARIDAAIGRVDSRVAARADKIARAKADADAVERDLGSPTDPEPRNPDASERELTVSPSEAPFWHPEAES